MTGARYSVRAGFYAVTVQANWLTVFRFVAEGIDLVDCMTAENEAGWQMPTGQPLLYLVPMDGLELSTFALRMRCSTN